MGELPDIKEDVDLNELPPPPDDISDKEAFDTWMMVVKRFVHIRGDEREAQGRSEGYTIGKGEGEVIGETRSLLKILEHRNIEVSDDEAKQILACRDTNILKRYWDKVFVIKSVKELLEYLN
ncbi:MAG: hypothetical protein JW841_00625 [Deltaproteobacteria bacterium]|nr:hypothetical protein [Deltaproteobacteria bacterium]